MNFENILQLTNSEVDVLQNELNLIKEMDSNFHRSESLKNSASQSVTEDLEAARKELEAIKAEGAKDKLEVARASEEKAKSKLEYDYLTGCAAGAREIADKKVSAAHAWVEALKASERETNIKTELVEREIGELKLKEVKRIEESKNMAESTTEELQQERHQKNKSFQEKRTRDHEYTSTPVSQPKFRRSLNSPATRRMSTSNSLSVKRRRNAMLKVAKYFANEHTENDKADTHN
ncbi:protein PLASTID MOVEMENT IMPAIRED 2-like [Spinacia oleracea]|uniref:Protein PLASTID MOVEMENT IMPAIRED 2-like n=1 Tax=Spinacia oleracea TaxID=3562 RepID=A0ABM3QYG8_SPIOL|nr:protein PLASTID MOVEMENT IMPAIRED 2-like [Spinacia oleracea]